MLIKYQLILRQLEITQFIYDSALEFGSQCIVVSIDVKLHMDNYFVFDNNKSAITDLPASEFVKQAENMGRNYY